MKLFLQKNAKFLSAGGSALRPQNSPPPLRISGYGPVRDKDFFFCFGLQPRTRENSGVFCDEDLFFYPVFTQDFAEFLAYFAMKTFFFLVFTTEFAMKTFGIWSTLSNSSNKVLVSLKNCLFPPPVKLLWIRASLFQHIIIIIFQD